MAKRPVFETVLNKNYFQKKDIEFEYFSGFSDTQKRKSIKSLHQEYLKQNPNKKVLEISSKSENELGVQLSAFNLKVKMKSGKEFTVESIFQSSKIFEKGGPYSDLLYVSSKIAKTDDRLRNSGNVIGFHVNGESFPITPQTYFYNWLYINTLESHKELADKIMEYDAFTDIAFNPKKSINCQAEAASIYVSLKRQNLLELALKDKNSFLNVVYLDYIQTEQLNFSFL